MKIRDDWLQLTAVVDSLHEDDPDCRVLVVLPDDYLQRLRQKDADESPERLASLAVRAQLFGAPRSH